MKGTILLLLTSFNPNFATTLFPENKLKKN